MTDLSGEAIHRLGPSEIFGRTEGLQAYKLARSMDAGSDRPDQPIAVLADDAVRTAHQWAWQADREVPGLDVEVATRALIAALEEEALPSEA